MVGTKWRANSHEKYVTPHLKHGEKHFKDCFICQDRKNLNKKDEVLVGGNKAEDKKNIN